MAGYALYYRIGRCMRYACNIDLVFADCWHGILPCLLDSLAHSSVSKQTVRGDPLAVRSSALALAL